MTETADMNDSSHSSQCSGGDCSNFVSFAERMIAVWVVCVWMVFDMRESACFGRI
jgi:hypothetical protein